MARTTRAMASASNGPEPDPPATSTDIVKKAPVKRKIPFSSKKSPAETQPDTPTSSRKRTRSSVKEEQPDTIELPHNLGTFIATRKKDQGAEDGKSPSKRVKLSAQDIQSVPDIQDNIKTEDATEVADVKTTPKKAKKANKVNKVEKVKEIETDKKGDKVKKVKKHKWVKLGVSPYPNHEGPTSEQCYEVWEILTKEHGRFTRPDIVPIGTLDAAGCGEVPNVVEALVRTILSAATTGSNAKMAVNGLFKDFGFEGKNERKIFKWDEIRLAPQADVQEAIKRGGLAKNKSGFIQSMLQMAWEENQVRKAAHLDPSAKPEGAENEDESQKQQEISQANQDVISLDHIHLLNNEDALNKMITYPGIGIKTASCVSLFCLQRASFAVDTHVFRMCQYLDWVPKEKCNPKGTPSVTPDTTFLHCDSRVPDDLKYELHQLFLQHGKKCPRCRAITGENHIDWAKGCVLEHLVKRHGARKGGVPVANRKKAKAAPDLSDDDEEVDGEDDEEVDEASIEDEDGGEGQDVE